MFGALIGAAGSLINGVLGRRSQNASTRQANAANQRQFDASLNWSKDSLKSNQAFSRAERQRGQRFNSREAKAARDFLADQADTDREWQKRFAKNSAGWQFDDLMEAADSAGIHRLAALGGATGNAFTPAGGGTAQASSPGGPGVSMAGSPSGGTVLPEIGGSIVGDGMNAIADVVISEQARREQQAREAKAEQIGNVERAAKLDVMSAEAEMYRARAAESHRRASLPAYPPSAAYGHPAGVEGADRRATLNYGTLSGNTVPVSEGPDPFEWLMGLGIEGAGAAKKAVKDKKGYVQEGRITPLKGMKEARNSRFWGDKTMTHAGGSW